MELKNRKGMDYCFPLGIIQFENGDLYYIDPFKSLFLVILFPIRIFFPVKLYKITDREEKKLAYGRYRDDKLQNMYIWRIASGLAIAEIINIILGQINIVHTNIDLIMKITYIAITTISFLYIFIRRYTIIKMLNLENYKYKYVKIKMNELAIIYFPSVILSCLTIYFVFSYKSNGILHPSLLLVYIIFAPFFHWFYLVLDSNTMI
ncbi:MAG: hypothetical protein MR601_08705 [Erysipelotrichaceae bacterium]|nr:hypothetical protein [Erysipelotrichaceae bacterium]